MSDEIHAILIFPYGGMHTSERKSDLFFRLVETAIKNAREPITVVVNEDTVARDDACTAPLEAWIKKGGWKGKLDIIRVWSVDTCQMWLHGWGHALEKMPEGGRIVQLPGDLSRLNKADEFFTDRLPAFIGRNDKEVILGDFTTGDVHSAKDLIDQYGTMPLMANWFPEAARQILYKPILHPRTEFLNIHSTRLRELLSYRKFAYEQTLNMLIQLWYERGAHYWEESMGVEDLGQIEDDTGFRKYRDCLDQIERMERMLKMMWRERNWKESIPPQEVDIDRFELLDKRSTAIRETAGIIIRNILSLGS